MSDILITLWSRLTGTVDRIRSDDMVYSNAIKIFGNVLIFIEKKLRKRNFVETFG